MTRALKPLLSRRGFVHLTSIGEGQTISVINIVPPSMVKYFICCNRTRTKQSLFGSPQRNNLGVDYYSRRINGRKPSSE